MSRSYLVFIIVVAVASPVLAQSALIPGLIAKRETDLMAHEDKLAAYGAEQAVLSSDWGTQGYNWEGPKGAYGTIISGAVIPHPESKQLCRRFIHIVHHANDGGANPTFQGMICRGFPDGQWEPKEVSAQN